MVQFTQEEIFLINEIKKIINVHKIKYIKITKTNAFCKKWNGLKQYINDIDNNIMEIDSNENEKIEYHIKSENDEIEFENEVIQLTFPDNNNEGGKKRKHLQDSKITQNKKNKLFMEIDDNNSLSERNINETNNSLSDENSGKNINEANNSLSGGNSGRNIDEAETLSVDEADNSLIGGNSGGNIDEADNCGGNSGRNIDEAKTLSGENEIVTSNWLASQLDSIDLSFSDLVIENNFPYIFGEKSETSNFMHNSNFPISTTSNFNNDMINNYLNYSYSLMDKDLEIAKEKREKEDKDRELREKDLEIQSVRREKEDRERELREKLEKKKFKRKMIDDDLKVAILTLENPKYRKDNASISQYEENNDLSKIINDCIAAENQVEAQNSELLKNYFKSGAFLSAVLEVMENKLSEFPDRNIVSGMIKGTGIAFSFKNKYGIYDENLQKRALRLYNRSIRVFQVYNHFSNSIEQISRATEIISADKLMKVGGGGKDKFNEFLKDIKNNVDINYEQYISNNSYHFDSKLITDDIKYKVLKFVENPSLNIAFNFETNV